MEHDEKLRADLRQWQVTTGLPPGFQAAVWQRIARAEERKCLSLRAAFLNWLETMLPRPVLAGSYVTVLLASGLIFGGWQAKERTDRIESSLSARYVQAVDPYQSLQSEVR